ncbi:MAG TPA: SAM-dependent methyltransferase [Planctomycetota bacterium]|nr:SAM-dependent methyltransferase [Planctomycetota bacterium]
MRSGVFPHPEFPDYALLDSGAGEKLERFGKIVLRRPDPQALWRPRLPASAWAEAHLAFERDPESGGRRGRWIASPRAPAAARSPSPSWTVRRRDATCIVRPTPFKHVGVFPEQAANWAWTSALADRLGERPRLLNLFGYTGVASVVAAQSGYAVTHVDASKTSLAWTRENAAASGLAEDALRIVLDDSLAFARREARRGARYEGLLVDPPHHGRGPKGERWQLEEDLAPLMEACRELLAPRGFVVLSTYAVGFSPLAFENLLAEFEGGSVATGELALPEESAPPAQPPRLLPCGFCARFWRGVEA